MADYTYRNGNITMMIRDNGIGNNYVEYWVLTDQYTFNHQQDWEATGYGRQTFDMNNRGSWQYIASAYIGSSQNVSFTMYNEGLGFPTYTFTVWISRATVPAAPYWYDVHPTSSSSIWAQFGSSGDGGAAVDTWQIGYGTDPNYPQYYTNTYVQDIGGLSNAYTWYFWGRGHNSVGWGPWSARAQANPWRVPDAPTIVTPSAPTNNKIHASFRGNWDGGRAVDNWQVGYGTDPNTPQLFKDYANSGEVDITALVQNSMYYFWARGHNDQGWGPWGARGNLKTQGTPDGPSGVATSAATQTTMATSFALNADNGQPITGQQIGWGTNPDAPEFYIDVALSDVLRELPPGTLLYFWSRAKNVYGWGALSVRTSARTIAGAWLNVNGVWKEAVPYINVNGVWKPAQVWAKIAGAWKETR